MYTPHTPEDKKLMLEKIGVKSFEELLSVIPDKLRFNGKLDLPEPLSELEAVKHCQEIAGRNKHQQAFISFLGGGAYDHYIPSVINHIISRSEFYTAYTPYQAEVSQGTLQAIYEYQSLICELFGMDISNAGMYDAASAFAETCHMARSITKKNKILIADTIHPYYRQVINTYTHGLNIPIVDCGCELDAAGRVTLSAFENSIDNDTAAVLVQNPNFYGVLEPVRELAEIAHKHGALFIICVDPISLGLLNPPGNYGADIAVGEGQSLGIPASLGGPYLGILACRKDYVRMLPGRLVGKTADIEGKPGYVLVLQTREQHIRRDKATSNICTNEALCALAATVYLSVMGKQGIAEVAKQSYAKSHYLAQEISKVNGFSLAFKQPFFKEFVVKTEKEPSYIINRCLKEKIFAGIDMSRLNQDWQNMMLVCATEMRSKQEIDKFVKLLKELH
ncbi:MAG: aminomethyl-transferring glycine dehydrogenase subunit GcvPA [Candidatus Latescibacteria bacterium]|nr:aminomethyl-transferring glycine dehydrogenase subunit GcvPA [Candidatus Latescibacterota bacterium]